MAESSMRLIKRIAEFQPVENVKLVPPGRRGLYVLYRRRKQGDGVFFNVVYIGMGTTGIRARLKTHRRNKDGLWTHFSAFEVWDNIRDEEIVELEGLFRFFYRKDKKANSLNIQRNFWKAKHICKNDLRLWGQQRPPADATRPAGPRPHRHTRRG